MSFRVSIVLYRNTSWPLYFTVQSFNSNSYRYIMEEAGGAGRRVAAHNVEQLAQADSQGIRAIQDAVEVWLAILEVGARWFKWSVLVKLRIRMSMQLETIHATQDILPVSIISGAWLTSALSRPYVSDGEKASHAECIYV
jgi:hypothetical protein